VNLEPHPPDRRAEHLDAWNARVAPTGWTNPTPAGRYNLVVIGAGPAGLVCAAGAAGLGARVALIERHRLGGDCLNVGCVPSKGLIAAARAAAGARDAERFGVSAGPVKADFARVMERLYRVRTELSAHDSAERFAGLGVDVFLGEGRFTGPDRIAVGDAELRFARAVIATGARPVVPPVPGLAELNPRTNETIFELNSLPARLAVLGGGPIGCELAQAFARLGSAVTLIEKGSRILPRDEAQASERVRRALEADGVEVRTGTRVVKAGRQGGTPLLTVARDGAEAEVAADEVLVAAGRAPNVESLDLEAAGIAYGPRGVTVDARLRTRNPRVYAAGDVCFPYQFTHAADACARIVIGNALFKGRSRADRLVVPWCTYTQPEVAHVGITEAEAEGQDVDVVEVPTAGNDRGRLDGDDAGYARVYLKRGTDRILGATVVADHAGDLIGEMAVAVTNQVRLGGIGATIHAYPTRSEVWKKAADAYRRGKLTPTVHTWLKRWLAFTR
jgi:pyruvate/2-oxoglutarate dehydrogenase complex dihydrolipoamide dehydrogenase (E3) component